MSAQVLSFSGRIDGADEASELFDQVARQISHRSVSEAMTQLVQGLHGLRRSLSSDAWQAVKSDWMQHPLARIVHQDPLTSWSYRKPRGYPGDATLLELIHGEVCVAAEIAAATELGRAIHACTSRSAIAMGLRAPAHHG